MPLLHVIDKVVHKVCCLISTTQAWVSLSALLKLGHFGLSHSSFIFFRLFTIWVQEYLKERLELIRAESAWYLFRGFCWRNHYFRWRSHYFCWRNLYLGWCLIQMREWVMAESVILFSMIWRSHEEQCKAGVGKTVWSVEVSNLLHVLVNRRPTFIVRSCFPTDFEEIRQERTLYRIQAVVVFVKDVAQNGVGDHTWWLTLWVWDWKVRQKERSKKEEWIISFFLWVDVGQHQQMKQNKPCETLKKEICLTRVNKSPSRRRTSATADSRFSERNSRFSGRNPWGILMSQTLLQDIVTFKL